MGLRLYVVRHGETEWTRARRYTGWRDIALSAAGIAQSRLVARALSRCPLARIYASPLARTRMSAEVIAEPHGLPVHLDPDFREMGLGEWEGLTRAEVADRDPAAIARWRADPRRCGPPGGESLTALIERVAAAVERLRARHDGHTVVVVTHAIVIRVMMLEALGGGVERMWSIDVAPASITDLEYDRSGAILHAANRQAREFSP